MKIVKLHLGYAGYCLAKENDAIAGGKKRKIKFQALWGLILHPTKGYILFDTGYTERFYKATKNYPNKLYADITKVKIKKEETIKFQLEAAGFSTEDIAYVFISHFHADHVGGLKDFPSAQIITSRVAWDYTKTLPHFRAFSRGVLLDLIPSDLDERIVFIEDLQMNSDPIFNRVFDVFGDESILVYELPGHARGQTGIKIATVNATYFLIADACWLKASYEHYILPNPIVRLFFDSWSDFKTSLKNVHLFHKQFPKTKIVPTHCSESTDPLVSNQINLNVL